MAERARKQARLPDDLMGRAAPCFVRREPRRACRDMMPGLLAELEDHNCCTMAEAAGEKPSGSCAGEERRELAGVPGDVMPAARPGLAGHLLQHAHDQGIRAGFVAGGEVHGGPGLRKGIRERGTGYVLAARPSYAVTLPSGRRLTVKTAASLVKPGMWQRMRTFQVLPRRRVVERTLAWITRRLARQPATQPQAA